MEFQVLGILHHFDFLQIWPNFPFKTWIIVHGGQKINEVAREPAAGCGKIILIVPVMHCAWPDVEASSGNPQVVLDEFIYK